MLGTRYATGLLYFKHKSNAGDLYSHNRNGFSGQRADMLLFIEHNLKYVWLSTCMHVTADFSVGLHVHDYMMMIIDDYNVHSD